MDEHLFEAFYHCAITRFPYPTVVCRIEPQEYVTTGIGLSRELYEERRKQIAQVLFVGVPEVEIEVGQRGLPSIIQ